jgi:signal transduction histidine kinase
MHSSVGEIRTRLLSLLVRAFVFVLSLALVFFLAAVSYFLTARASPISMPFTGALQGYYMGHGSWEGVETIFGSINELNSLDILLLDASQHIVVDRDSNPLSTVGSRYEIRPNDLALNMEENGQRVGVLVVTALSPWNRLGIARAIIFPVGLISLLLSIFLIIVASLLVRRFVNPLADVIYAAREVTNGKLGTRISSEGPQDMRSLSDSFNEMAASLERNDRERRDMLADIAHELRTPLSVIRGRLEGIMDGIYTADGGQVSLALEQTYVLERLVDDLRLLTLAESRQLQFEKKSTDLNQLARHTLDLFSAEAREKNISLSLEAFSGDIKVEVDPQRMEQVMGNLIGNSIRYISEGSSIWLAIEEVNGTAIQLCINDNGPGVPEEDLPYLFDRFWRKDKSRSRAAGGTGLGLAIAKQLIEAQEGTIEARNLPEGGLQIRIALKALG